MLLAQFSNVTRSFGSDDVLRGVSWQLSDGLKCGLVGENGAGKTTLFRLLTGEQVPDSGDVVIKRGVHIGYIEQEMKSAPGATLRSEAMRALAHMEEMERELETLSAELSRTDHEMDPDALGDLLERYAHLHERYERDGGYSLEARLHEVLDGLSFLKTDLDRPLEDFSGGQKTRAALARVILRAPDILLLDEPTNHLDIHAIEWLEDFLADYSGAYIVISHDRYFLDRLAKEIVELHRGSLRFYRGNYSAFLEERDVRLAQEWKAYDLQQDEITRTEDFIRKNLAGQKTKQAQSRRKMLEKIERLPRPAGRAHVMNLELPEPERSGRLVLELKKISKAYDGVPVLKNVTFSLQRGEKMGIIGPNGAGKSTLLRLLIGQEGQDSGHLRLGAGVTIGYFEQEQKSLRGPHSVLEEIWKVTPLVTENEIRNFLGAFLFSGDDVLKPLNALSGGERSRLALARIVRTRANLLILDEPTNHLDIPSRAVFEQALADFKGTIVTVSHDRYFLDRVADRILELEDGIGTLYLGNYSDWKSRKATALAEACPVPAAAPPPPPPAAAPVRDRRREEDREARKRRDQWRKQVDSLESRIAEREREKSEVAVLLEEATLRADRARLGELGSRYEILEREIADLLVKWEEMQAMGQGSAR
jgi:ATP-binding cassette subfamily F protein 3